MAGRELAKVDPEEEPSAEWGWHGSFPRATSIAGVASAIILVLLLIGHPTSVTEILWLVLPAAAVLAAVVVGNLRKRHDWRR
jgi:Na+-driven multidrug efflux pump